jgi:Carboxypeptidase regulatory-like domain
MTRRSRIAWVIAATAVLGGVAWWLWRPARSMVKDDAALGTRTPGRASRGAADPGDAFARAQRAGKLPFGVPPGDQDVTITGRVVDVDQQKPVGGVEVVFRGPAGEVTTTSYRNGSYAIRLPAGVYHAFVRDEAVMSFGRPDGVRLPALPSAETVGVPDEALMTIVVASADTDEVDLSVVRGGFVSGRVIDREGRPIVGAVLRARSSAGGRGGLRPTLATDITESDRTGTFELRLPPGPFDLEAAHPQFAGVDETSESRVIVVPGLHVHATIILAAGCVITGRVIRPNGAPASDGAIEKQWGQGEMQFGPAGRIEADGTFRWVTTEETGVTLRAWPWKSPPSPSRTFSCRDGTRFDDVVFRLPVRAPDIAGWLRDHDGEPVGFAFIDLVPLDGGGIAQQERTDAEGRWSVFQMPRGRYRVTAHAEGRGVVSQTIESPHDSVLLELGGTGRLEGTTSRLASGSFELTLGTCVDANALTPLPQSRRLVTVAGGRFTVDDLPACELSYGITWRGTTTQQRTEIPSGGVAHIEIDLGEPRAKTVHGVVRDGAGKPIAGALVTATFRNTGAVSVRTAADGTYRLDTFSTASLRAAAEGVIGFAQVGAANVDREQVDLVVEDDSDVEVDD